MAGEGPCQRVFPNGRRCRAPLSAHPQPGADHVLHQQPSWGHWWGETDDMHDNGLPALYGHVWVWLEGRSVYFHTTTVTPDGDMAVVSADHGSNKFEVDPARLLPVSGVANEPGRTTFRDAAELGEWLEASATPPAPGVNDPQSGSWAWYRPGRISPRDGWVWVAAVAWDLTSAAIASGPDDAFPVHVPLTHLSDYRKVTDMTKWAEARPDGALWNFEGPGHSAERGQLDDVPEVIRVPPALLKAPADLRARADTNRAAAAGTAAAHAEPADGIVRAVVLTNTEGQSAATLLAKGNDLRADADEARLQGVRLLLMDYLATLTGLLAMLTAEMEEPPVVELVRQVGQHCGLTMAGWQSVRGQLESDMIDAGERLDVVDAELAKLAKV